MVWTNRDHDNRDHDTCADCLVGVVFSAMVSGPESVVAQLGGAAVMIRGGSRRVWCHSVRRGWVGADEVS
jgi:hypothetical protein